MNKSKMEITQNLSPMDIRFRGRKRYGGTVNYLLQPEIERTSIEGVETERLDIDYSLEPQIDDSHLIVEDEDVKDGGRKITKPDLKKKRKSSKAKSVDRPSKKKS